ncbi:MAG: lipopolysaccharide biosynthesis protein [Planctomycetaceae bacterium]
MSTQTAGSADLSPTPGQGIRLSGYISTAAISVANIVAVVAVTGILARAFSEDQFLLYGKANRYMNFLFCITNGSLGYAIVRYGSFGDESKRKQVLFNALCLVGGLTLLVSATVRFSIDEIATALNEPRFSRGWMIYCSLWLFGQSFLHIILAYLRSSSQLTLANKVHWTSKTLCILSAASIIWIMSQWVQAPLSVPQYYGLVGVLVTTTCILAFASQWKNLEPTLNPKLCGHMIGFSSTRIVDALLKNSFLVVVLTLLGRHSPASARIAGQVAVITFLLRGIEALCQPLVMLVMTDSLAKDSKERIRRMVETGWIALATFTLPMMLVLFMLCEPIVKLYLGTRFQGLGEEFGIISLSLLPTVAVVLFRGHLDGKLKISPIMYANILGVLAIGSITWYLLEQNTVTLRTIAWSIVAIRWLQFVFVMWLLNRMFGVIPYRREAVLQVWTKLQTLVRKIRSRG